MLANWKKMPTHPMTPPSWCIYIKNQDWSISWCTCFSPIVDIVPAVEASVIQSVNEFLQRNFYILPCCVPVSLMSTFSGWKRHLPGCSTRLLPGARGPALILPWWTIYNVKSPVLDFPRASYALVTRTQVLTATSISYPVSPSVDNWAEEPWQGHLPLQLIITPVIMLVN